MSYWLKCSKYFDFVSSSLETDSFDKVDWIFQMQYHYRPPGQGFSRNVLRFFRGLLNKPPCDDLIPVVNTILMVRLRFEPLPNLPPPTPQVKSQAPLRDKNNSFDSLVTTRRLAC